MPAPPPPRCPRAARGTAASRPRQHRPRRRSTRRIDAAARLDRARQRRARRPTTRGGRAPIGASPALPTPRCRHRVDLDEPCALRGGAAVAIDQVAGHRGRATTRISAPSTSADLLRSAISSSDAYASTSSRSIDRRDHRRIGASPRLDRRDDVTRVADSRLPAITSSIASASSIALWNRSSGDFAIALSISSCSPTGSTMPSRHAIGEARDRRRAVHAEQLRACPRPGTAARRRSSRTARRRRRRYRCARRSSPPRHGLLGRHVVRRADDDVRLRRIAADVAAQAREPEIEDADVLAGARSPR